MFPFNSRIGEVEKDGRWFLNCPASIINKKWVITASHCVFKNKLNPDKLLLRVGSIVEMPNFSQVGLHQGKMVSIKNIILHPGYEHVPFELDWTSFNTPNPLYPFLEYYNDIALLELTQPLDFSENIAPILLANENDFVNGVALTSLGWSAIDPHFGGSSIETSQYPILQYLTSSHTVGYATKKHMSIQYPAAGMGPRVSDSGSAALIKHSSFATDKGFSYVHVGNLHGIDDAALSSGDRPVAAVYTMTAPYADWIYQQTGLHKAEINVVSDTGAKFIKFYVDTENTQLIGFKDKPMEYGDGVKAFAINQATGKHKELWAHKDDTVDKRYKVEANFADWAYIKSELGCSDKPKCPIQLEFRFYYGGDYYNAVTKLITID